MNDGKSNFSCIEAWLSLTRNSGIFSALASFSDCLRETVLFMSFTHSGAWIVMAVTAVGSGVFRKAVAAPCGRYAANRRKTVNYLYRPDIPFHQRDGFFIAHGLV